jgi:homoserine kinase type II
MALLTPLNRLALDGIAEEFALEVFSARHIEGGAKNTSYLISAREGCFVATVLEHRSLAFAQAYGAFLQQVVDRRLPAPPPRRTRDGEWSYAHSGKPIVLTSFVRGSPKGSLSSSGLFRLGALLADIHDSGLERNVPPTVRLDESDIRWLENAGADRFANWALTRHQRTVGVLQGSGIRRLTHGDPFRDNVLVGQNGSLVLVDWEEAASDLPAIDLAMTVLSHCMEPRLNSIRVERLAAGYAAHAISPVPVTTIIRTAAYAGLVIAYRRYRRHLNGLTPPAAYLSMQRIAEQLSEHTSS